MAIESFFLTFVSSSSFTFHHSSVAVLACFQAQAFAFKSFASKSKDVFRTVEDLLFL
jgi:hypothetical protein